jgi:hypothetical protein
MIWPVVNVHGKENPMLAAKAASLPRPVLLALLSLLIAVPASAQFNSTIQGIVRLDLPTAFPTSAPPSTFPPHWRRGNQFNGRIDYELRPGKDRLYGNLYRTTSYTVNGGIRPAFDVLVLETTQFANVNHTHLFQSTKLNELRGGMMRLVGATSIRGPANR